MPSGRLVPRAPFAVPSGRRLSRLDARDPPASRAGRDVAARSSTGRRSKRAPAAPVVRGTRRVAERTRSGRRERSGHRAQRDRNAR